MTDAAPSPMKCLRCYEPAPFDGAYMPAGAKCPRCGGMVFGGLVNAVSGGAGELMRRDDHDRITAALTAEAEGLRGERDAAVKALTRILVVCEHEADSAQDISRAEVGFWRDEIASITEALRAASAAGGAREGACDV